MGMDGRQLVGIAEGDDCLPLGGGEAHGLLSDGEDSRHSGPARPVPRKTPERATTVRPTGSCRLGRGRAAANYSDSPGGFEGFVKNPRVLAVFNGLAIPKRPYRRR